MSAEDNKAIARRYWEEVWSTGNVAMVDEIVAPESLFHSGGSINTRDNEARKQGTTRWRTWVPDLRTTIDDIFAEGDKVVVRWTTRGTHRGNIAIGGMTIPPTGKQISYVGMDIFHFRVARSWNSGATGTGWVCWSSSGWCLQRGRCTRLSM